MTPEDKLAKLGLELPKMAAPVANYIPYKRIGSLLYISGQVPVSGGEVAFRGCVGREIEPPEARSAARLAMLNVLAAAKAAVGDLAKLEAVRVEGFVASTSDFTEHPKVVNGASDLLVEVLGDAGRHTRFAVGVAALPLGVPVEIAAVFSVKD